MMNEIYSRGPITCMKLIFNIVKIKIYSLQTIFFFFFFFYGELAITKEFLYYYGVIF